MKEKIAQIRCLHCDEYSHHKQSCLITPNINRFCPDALSYANQILTLLKEEIEKVENPAREFRKNYPQNQTRINQGQADGFEYCRNEILKMLNENKTTQD